MSVAGFEANARAEVLALMREREADCPHVTQVMALALQLFDQTAPLHGFGPAQRLWLEAAACLHDIGHRSDRDGVSHHLESARAIREQAWRWWSPAEVELVAQVARYHRKSMPALADPEYAALGESDRRVVRTLAALLRLADALDRTHAQLVRRVTVQWTGENLVLELVAAGPVREELAKAGKKGDLARAVFNRELVFKVAPESSAAA